MGVSESKVGVAVDGAGKSIRNVSYYTLIDGVPTLVQSQVLGGITDDNGTRIDLEMKPVLQELLETQERTATLLELILHTLGGSSASIDSRGDLAGFQASTQLGPKIDPGGIVNGISDAFGRQIVLPWGARDQFCVGLPATITDATSHPLVSLTNDTYLDLVMLLVSNTSATAVRVDVSDGTNVYPLQCAAGVATGFASGLILPATSKGVGWTIIASASVTDLRVISLFVRNK
jgi:hypothetical protein